MTISCASGDDTIVDSDVSQAGGSAGKGVPSSQGGANAGGSGGATAGSGGATAGKSGGGSGGATGGSAGKSGGGGAGQSGAGGAGNGGSAGSAGNAGEAGESGAGGEAGATTGGSAGNAGSAGSACNEQPEICNGLDDNCNGEKDENVQGTNEPCTVPNKQGECAFGSTQCLKGKLECVQNQGASVEICDGKDNNCDGQIDNNPTDVGSQCFTDQKGLCAQGTMKCEGGETKCISNFTPTDESCNGFDDNCDGNVDEGFPGAGQPCTIPNLQGPCAQGQTTCQNSGNSCAQVVFPQSETCDGVDNDCDGQIDEKEDVEGQSCDTGQLGECAKGTTKCDQGKPGCQAQATPQPEVCDGKDNDCDGDPDNISASKLKTECAKEFPSGQNIQDWKCDLGECVIALCGGNFVDCNGSPSDGCEVDSSKDINNCGACGTSCPAINGTPTCIAKQCGIVCNAGFGDCDGQPGNGCEQSLNNDANNCGICSKKCSDAGGTGVCNGGTCKTECDAGKADCDNNGANGCETDTSSNANNCGVCGKVCSAANATPSCENGLCKPICKPGYADCDGDPANGCEVNLKNNKDNCGACENSCNSTNGSATCSNGLCGLSCLAGYGDCDLDSNNGCEVNTSTSVVNCGECGTKCDTTNNTPSCKLGVCTVKCNVGFKDCNTNADDGCEIDINSDVNNCGACGNKCNSDKGTAVCDNGTCKIAACNQGYANCDGSAANGCETNTTGDVNNCGVCNNKCSTSGGGASCNGGSCGISCAAPNADCNNSAGDGCEVNLNSNLLNCGLCGNACATGNASSTSCQIGKCAPICNAGFADCNKLGPDGCEVNLTNDVNNCGGCGTKCVATNADGASCAANKCVFQCKPGFADCDNNPSNGCETNIASDNANCGQCGQSCVVANGVGACSGGICTVTGCSAPFDNCDGNAANGCETNTNISVTNCGGCNNACSTNNASPVCEAAQCKTGTCQGTFADCNSNPNDGCEVNLASNVNNCGTCGTVCSLKSNATSMACSASTCQVATCSTGFFDVDGQGGNGCECAEDNVGNTCGAATDIGSINFGSANVVKTFNLTGGGTDEDWFKVTFPSAATCGYTPFIELSAGALPIKMQVYTGCSGNSSTGSITCGGGNEPANSNADINRWELTYTGNACGDKLGSDPTPDDGTPFTKAPQTFYVRVRRTGADPTDSCMSYTLTFSNN